MKRAIPDPKVPLPGTPTLALVTTRKAKKRVRRVTSSKGERVRSSYREKHLGAGRSQAGRKATVDLCLINAEEAKTNLRAKPSQGEELSVKPSITRPSAASAKLGLSGSSSEVGMRREAPIFPGIDSSFRRFSIFLPKS